MATGVETTAPVALNPAAVTTETERAVTTRRRLAILGCTGSVGRQTLAVVEAFPDRFCVVGLAARHDSPQLREQAARHGIVRPIATERDGLDALATLAADPSVDLVVVASSGLAALVPTLEAVRAGKIVALANKEIVVAAGELLLGEVRRRGGVLLPVDSEHAAIWQCLTAGAPAGATPVVGPVVQRLLLTASGGPFRTYSAEQMRGVTAGDALAHPTWAMGHKITVDSATLMNKGLELLEAAALFDVPLDRIDIVVHPQSIVHSMVEYADGSVLAQLALPDMRLPIQQALFWPDRQPSPWPRLDWTIAHTLTFEPPDTDRFPCLALAREAGRLGGLAPAALIGADDEAVARFLTGAISFTDIPRLIERVLSDAPTGPVTDLETAEATSAWAARRVRELSATRG